MDNGLITTLYVPSGVQLADVLTQGLPTERFMNLTGMLGMVNIHSPALGGVCTGFMNMETNTNPIDRTIAHLLFHRPSDPSRLLPLSDPLPFKSSSMLHGSVINPAVVTEKLVCQEESST
ncbi:Protein LNK1, partial [Mucuna pruriens]